MHRPFRFSSSSGMYRDSPAKRRTTEPYKRIKCPDCEIVPHNRHHWEHHRMMHTGEKPYACHRCDYVCISKYTLSAHMKAKHGFWTFRCPLLGCGFSFSRNIDLKNHVSAVHETAKPLTCDHPGCEFQTALRVCLFRHSKQVHPVERTRSTGCLYRSEVDKESLMWRAGKKEAVNCDDSGAEVLAEDLSLADDLIEIHSNMIILSSI